MDLLRLPRSRQGAERGSEDVYRRLTGGALAPTLAFVERLAELGTTVWVRYVLVPGWTDAPAEVEAVADRCAALPNVARVDVLPFHTLGQTKYERLGLTFPLEGTPAPTREDVAAAAAVFAARGLVVA